MRRSFRTLIEAAAALALVGCFNVYEAGLDDVSAPAGDENADGSPDDGALDEGVAGAGATEAPVTNSATGTGTPEPGAMGGFDDFFGGGMAGASAEDPIAAICESEFADQIPPGICPDDANPAPPAGDNPFADLFPEPPPTDTPPPPPAAADPLQAIVDFFIALLELLFPPPE